MTLIEAQHVTKTFVMKKDWLGRPRKVLTAVDDVSLSVCAGETIGLVGESGCGKSTFARTVMGLYDMTKGTVLYKGRDTVDPAVAKAYRRKTQMIFQDPYSSLDPRMTVGEIIAEPLRNYGIDHDDKARRDHVAQLLDMVELRPEAACRYPHEFSGGQRQRVGIARALASSPECVFCDEPISALDVSVQVQIINMMKDLQERLGLAYVFIAHDLAMVHHMSHRIGVMYLGRLVELGPGDAVFHRPIHPYTKLLVSAVPPPDPRAKRRVVIEGDLPEPFDMPSGCVFQPRCPDAADVCRQERPAWRRVAPGRYAACHAAAGGGI